MRLTTDQKKQQDKIIESEVKDLLGAAADLTGPLTRLIEERGKIQDERNSLKNQLAEFDNMESQAKEEIAELKRKRVEDLAAGKIPDFISESGLTKTEFLKEIDEWRREIEGAILQKKEALAIVEKSISNEQNQIFNELHKQFEKKVNRAAFELDSILKAWDQAQEKFSSQYKTNKNTRKSVLLPRSTAINNAWPRVYYRETELNM